MKRISAVICELNPLHDGHRYLLSRAGEGADVLVAVMSGNFVQRGESAVYDKYKRAEAAILAGADIVLELPFPFSSSSAEFFSRAGVRIAEAAGATHLFFGSECGDIDALKRAGAVLSGDEYRESMKVGRSAAMRAELLKSLCPDLPNSLFDSPNDILGAEYCRHVRSSEPICIKRISAESATSIRNRLVGAEGSDMLDPFELFSLEYSHFRTMRELPRGIAECGGGVLERLHNTAFECGDPKSWLENVKTKQYTDSRLRRAALFALCGVTAEEMREEPLYTRVLAVGKQGREYLSYLKKTAQIPIITNASDKRYLSIDAKGQVLLSEFADSIYNLCLNARDPLSFGKSHPVVLE